LLQLSNEITKIRKRNPKYKQEIRSALFKHVLVLLGKYCLDFNELEEFCNNPVFKAFLAKNRIINVNLKWNGDIPIDTVAQEYPRNDPGPFHTVPIKIVGDGNCLMHCFSRVSNMCAEECRVRMISELVLNKKEYLNPDVIC